MRTGQVRQHNGTGLNCIEANSSFPAVRTHRLPKGLIAPTRIIKD